MLIRDIRAKRKEGTDLILFDIIAEADPEQVAFLITDIRSGGQWDLFIKKEAVKRSIDANAYYWALVSKLAAKLRCSQSELHKSLILDYGAVKEDENGLPVWFDLEEGKDPASVCPYARAVSWHRGDRENMIRYAVYKGSHEMNSSEFSALLDGLIYECMEQGIDTAAVKTGKFSDIS